MSLFKNAFTAMKVEIFENNKYYSNEKISKN